MSIAFRPIRCSSGEIKVLTESPRPRKYWNALKTKLKGEGNELSHKLGQLKMKATDGKMRMTDIADTEQLLRLNSRMCIRQKAGLGRGVRRIVACRFSRHTTQHGAITDKQQTKPTKFYNLDAINWEFWVSNTLGATKRTEI